MRTTIALLFSLFGATCLAQQAVPKAWPAKTVDLAQPGALDRLERSNPDHYAKLIEVKRVAAQPSCVEDLKVLQADLKLDDARCAAMTTLTSYPPKRNVSVTIDGVQYMTYVPLGFAPAGVVPLAAAPKIVPAEP
jgi:hypothetical protein